MKLIKKELNILNGDLNLNKLKELKEIHEIYSYWSKLAESYFQNEKYTESNKVLKYCYDLLIHLTKNIICYNIELFMRKITYQHLSSSYPNLKIDDIIDIIDHILKGKYFKNKNMLDILYQDIPEKIVKNSVQYFFEDENDKNKFEFSSIREILNDYFDLLTVDPQYNINNRSPMIKMLKGDVISYFEIFSQKMINNWLSIVENQFRFVINQSRIIDCIIQIT